MTDRSPFCIAPFITRSLSAAHDAPVRGKRIGPVDVRFQHVPVVVVASRLKHAQLICDVLIVHDVMASDKS